MSEGTFFYVAVVFNCRYANARRFYINNKWGACPGDVGYLLVPSRVPDGSWTSCSYDYEISAILYAESNVGGVHLESATGRDHRNSIL